MRSLFFTTHIGEHIELTGDEGHHAASVVRLKAGEEIDVSDGHRLVHARVTEVGKSLVVAEIVADLPMPVLTPHLTVAQALIKGDAMGESVDLMTQVGVHQIIPWQAERSIVQWDTTKASKNIAKLNSQVLESSKQSRRPVPPSVDALYTTTQLQSRLGEFDRVILLHESGEEHLADDNFDQERVLLIVGPEGGLSESELAAIPGAIRKLGPTVIRSAQAGAIAATVIFAQHGWRNH